MPEKNWNGRKERSLCRRGCLRRYRETGRIQAGRNAQLFILLMKNRIMTCSMRKTNTEY